MPLPPQPEAMGAVETKEENPASYSPTDLIFGALVILPAARQDVHTRTRRRAPSWSTILAVCRLGSQRRLDLLLAWLTLFPVPGRLPHT